LGRAGEPLGGAAVVAEDQGDACQLAKGARQLRKVTPREVSGERLGQAAKFFRDHEELAVWGCWVDGLVLEDDTLREPTCGDLSMGLVERAIQAKMRSLKGTTVSFASYLGKDASRMCHELVF
jgi:hypothetical protein